MRDVCVLVVGLLPASRVKNFVLRRLGHRVAPGARVGPCVLIGVRAIEVEDGAVVGPGNVFRGVRALRVESGAVIGQLNWFTAAPFLVAEGDDDLAGSLHLGRCATITQRHYVDCAGGVVVAEFAMLAGVRSVLLTHEVDHRLNRLVSGPLRLEHYCLVSSNATIVMGAVVPEASLVAMGATVTRGLERPGRLYAGVPARDKGPVEGDYFRRVTNHVPPGARPSPASEPLEG